MAKGERDLLAGPSSVWENPKAVIDFLQDINSDISDFNADFLSGVRRGFTGVYRHLLAIAMRGKGFRTGDEGQQVKDLYQDYALEVFRRGDGSISSLRLGMAKEDPMRMGFIDFSVINEQRSGYIRVYDRVTKTGENGLVEQTTRELRLGFKADGKVDYDLQTDKKRRFTLESALAEVSAQI